MAAIAIWMFIQAGGSIAWSDRDALDRREMWRNIFAGGALWVAIYGTFVLNFCDFTRSATSTQVHRRGQLLGIPVNMLVFGAIVVVCRRPVQDQRPVIESPTDIVQSIPNTFLLVLACLALLILTIAVNLMANFVAPVYALTNLSPKYLNFRRAGLVSATIGLVILPWNLYNNPLVIVYFLGGLGALLGPLFGVIMADYWLVRRGQVNVPAALHRRPQRLPTTTAAASISARSRPLFLPHCLPSLIAFVPALERASPFSWFIGAGIAAVASTSSSPTAQPHSTTSSANPSPSPAPH